MISYTLFLCNRCFTIIRKHPWQFTLMIALTAMSLYLLGVVFFQQQQSGSTASEFDKTQGKRTFYATSEALSDEDYYTYTRGANPLFYEKLSRFLTTLKAGGRPQGSSDNHIFFTLTLQPVEVSENVIPEECLDGYEQGMAADSVFFYEGQEYRFTKCIQVSPAFFTIFNVTGEDGAHFSETDYLYERGRPIPVLLGNTYRTVFQVGDTFHGHYLFEDVTWQVAGFIEKDCFFYRNDLGDFTSTDRYIIMPAMQTQEQTDNSRIMLLQQMQGYIVSDFDFNTVQEYFESQKKLCDLENYDLQVINPDHTKDINRRLGAYSSMVTEVSRQFQIILALTVGFLFICIASVLCGLMKEREKELSILALCGASSLQLMGSVLLLTFLIPGLGLGIACLFLIPQQVSTECYFFLTGFSLFLFAALALLLAAYLRNMQLNNVIGGKE